MAIGEALFEAGIEAIEVPLNSPEPFRSIAASSQGAARGRLIGAGTVLTADDVDGSTDAGGRLLVSPNIDAAVMARAPRYGMVTMPGVFTPTEAFLALAAGASALKFFPASVLGPAGIAAISAVLPPQTCRRRGRRRFGQGFCRLCKIGVRTFGLGSSLFKPGMASDDGARSAPRRRSRPGTRSSRREDERMSRSSDPVATSPAELGEGPTYDPATDSAVWFDIVGRQLLEKRVANGATRGA